MAEQSVLEAKISDKISKKAWCITFFAFLLLPILLLIIGFASDQYHWDSWFGLRLEEGKLIVENLVWLIFIMLFLSTVPFAIYLILNLLKRKLTKLSVTEAEVIGVRTPVIPVAKISLRIPVDKIASVRKVKSSLFLYTGDEVCISTASSTFRIPFVLNADEIIAFLSEALTKKPAQGSQSDIAETLKKFAELRDKGMLTEEEFLQKKQEILSIPLKPLL